MLWWALLPAAGQLCMGAAHAALTFGRVAGPRHLAVQLLAQAQGRRPLPHGAGEPFTAAASPCPPVPTHTFTHTHVTPLPGPGRCELHNAGGVKGGITNFDPAEYEQDIPLLQQITQVGGGGVGA